MKWYLSDHLYEFIVLYLVAHLKFGFKFRIDSGYFYKGVRKEISYINWSQFFLTFFFCFFFAFINYFVDISIETIVLLNCLVEVLESIIFLAYVHQQYVDFKPILLIGHQA